MKKLNYLLICGYLMLSACTLLPFQKLHSTTSIKANDAFILGNNEHGKFGVRVKNISNATITIWQAPISGGKHSPLTLGPNQMIQTRVERNTALKIENSADQEVRVQLVVKGDIGLSMGYQN